jgi:UDP-glucuronate decarboxylase
MSKRVLITGGAGFLGSHLCERLLAAGQEVICLDNYFTGRRSNVEHLLDSHAFELIRHDVCDPIVLEVDEIYHLACPASPVHYQKNPVQTIRTCVQGTLNMLESARIVGSRLLIASTSEVYGDPLVHPQLETYWGNVNPIGPRACYDEGKRCAEALTISYAQQYNVDVRIARIFNTYGTRMLENDGRVVSNFIVQCLRDRPITIFGDGQQSRSFCYVDDLINGLLLLMASTETEPINLGNPAEHSMLELAEKVRRLTSSSSVVVHEKLPVDDPIRRRPDITRATERLGWSPEVPLERGLELTIADFQARFTRASRPGALPSERR